MNTASSRAQASASTSAVPLVIGRLKKRPQFLRAATGRKVHSALFTVQTAGRGSDESALPRVGLTVTRKVGGAVERNRIKRRLRDVIRTATDLSVLPSHDYVIVARRAVLDSSVSMLRAGLRHAIGTLHAPRTGTKPKRRDGNPGLSDRTGQAPVDID